MESKTIEALLSLKPERNKSELFQDILPEFYGPLKTNFENLNIWIRFGLTLSLTKSSPQSALQAFQECMRINQEDPLPAILAAKLLLEDLNDPENGLELADEAIKLCQKLRPSSTSDNEEKDQNPQQQSATITKNTNNHIDSNSSNDFYCYKNIDPLLSKCYLLASIMHAHIYEREPESIKQSKTSNLKASLNYLDLALETYSKDYLVYFHKALHEARQRSYPAAIDNLREAIKLNPEHVPSMQLLILCLSGLRMYQEALVLCESTLFEFGDNLLLLYIKCHLEQNLVETKGHKTALTTAQYMLKFMHRSKSSDIPDEKKPSTPISPVTTSGPTTLITTTTTTTISPSNQDTKQQDVNLFADDTPDRNKREVVSDELSVWLLVAEIFVTIGSIKDAELCVDEGLMHEDGALSHQIMFTRGLIAKAKNNLIEAKSFFQSCLALCPRHARALQQIAHVHYLLGSHSTAEKFLKDSLDVDSDCYKTWRYLSLVLIEQNQHDKAKECETKASKLEETSPVISLSVISRLTLE